MLIKYFVRKSQLAVFTIIFGEFFLEKILCECFHFQKVTMNIHKFLVLFFHIHTAVKTIILTFFVVNDKTCKTFYTFYMLLDLFSFCNSTKNSPKQTCIKFFATTLGIYILKRNKREKTGSGFLEVLAYYLFQ